MNSSRTHSRSLFRAVSRTGWSCLAGQGEPNANGGPPGDLLIRTHLRPHSYLERHGDHLYTLVSITFPQAALGDKVTVTGIGGEKLRLTVPAGTQSGTMLRIAGKGSRGWGEKGRVI